MMMVLTDRSIYWLELDRVDLSPRAAFELQLISVRNKGNHTYIYSGCKYLRMNYIYMFCHTEIIFIHFENFYLREETDFAGVTRLKSVTF